MPLRQIQIHLPASRSEAFAEVIEKYEIVPLWQGIDEVKQSFVSMIVMDAFDTDPLIQALSDTFESEEHFRVVLSEVAAIYPLPREEEDEEDSKDSEESDEEEPDALRVAIEELEQRLVSDSKLNSVFIITVLISALVAALGLMKDNAAVVIGAMVIAPLLSPNMTLALGTTLGKFSLIKDAFVANVTGLILTLIFSICFGLLVTFDPTGDEIASRASVTYSDVLLALASGVAGAIAVTTGVSAALVGVMVAVALMPPLVATGLLFGAGEWAMATHAALLTAINVIAVNLAAVGTFALRKIRPRSYWDSDKAKLMTRSALALWTVLLAVFTALIWFAGKL